MSARSERQGGRPNSTGRHRLADALRRYGFAGLMRQAILRLSQKIFEKRTVILFRAKPSEVHGRSLSAEFSIRILSRAELAVFDNAPYHGVLVSALQDGPSTQELHAAVQEGKIAAWGISFVGARRWPIPEVAATLSMAAEDSVLTSFFTLPEFRGRGLYQALMGRMAEHVASKGAESIQIWCDKENLASRAAIERVGFRHTATLRCLVIFGRCIRLKSRAVPGVQAP